MLAAVLHGMQGTPYVYQGEELGMTNVKFQDISDYKDIETINLYNERLEHGYEESDIMRSIYAKSRDNARTPMQWSAEAHAGFTTGEPWIAVNPNYKDINAEEERKDPDSVYSFYRKLIRLRKTHPVFVDGRFELLLPEDEKIFAYTRTDGEHQMLVCANFSGETAECPLDRKWKGAEMLIHNYNDDPAWSTDEEKAVLKPYEAMMLYR